MVFYEFDESEIDDWKNDDELTLRVLRNVLDYLENGYGELYKGLLIDSVRLEINRVGKRDYSPKWR